MELPAMRALLILLGSACGLLTACMVHPAASEVPHVKLIPKVMEDRILLQAVLHSRSTRPMALVDNPDFTSLIVIPKQTSSLILGCSFTAAKRASWKQVKVLPAGDILMLEKTIPYRREADGTWTMTVDYSAGNHGIYFTTNPECTATFEYSFDRKSKPLFWWLSGKRFLATPLETSRSFQLKP